MNKNMLGKLFGSNARVKILKLFLLHPDKNYFIRQISRDLKLQINSVRRELDNLEKFGLLLSSQEPLEEPAVEEDSIEGFLANSPKDKEKKKDSGPKNDKKYYRVNQNFILFEEIKALIVKAQVLYERDFVDKLSKVGKTKLLIFTGFFVNNQNSKVDMLIVGKLNRQKFIKMIEELESELGRELNYTLLDHKEFKYRRDITDVFLYDILENKKLVLVDEIGLS